MIDCVLCFGLVEFLAGHLYWRYRGDRDVALGAMLGGLLTVNGALALLALLG